LLDHTGDLGLYVYFFTGHDRPGRHRLFDDTGFKGCGGLEHDRLFSGLVVQKQNGPNENSHDKQKG
jgi:hypothetical protein